MIHDSCGNMCWGSGCQTCHTWPYQRVTPQCNGWEEVILCDSMSLLVTLRSRGDMWTIFASWHSRSSQRKRNSYSRTTNPRSLGPVLLEFMIFRDAKRGESGAFMSVLANNWTFETWWLCWATLMVFGWHILDTPYYWVSCVEMKGVRWSELNRANLSDRI